MVINIKKNSIVTIDIKNTRRSNWGLIEITIRRNENINNAIEERLENFVNCFTS